MSVPFIHSFTDFVFESEYNFHAMAISFACQQ